MKVCSVRMLQRLHFGIFITIIVGLGLVLATVAADKEGVTSVASTGTFSRPIHLDASTMRSLSEIFFTTTSATTSSSSSYFMRQSSVQAQSQKSYQPVMQLRYSKYYDQAQGKPTQRMLSSSQHLTLQQKPSPMSGDETAMPNQLTCDVQFTKCLDHPKCVACFQDFQERDMDWSIVAPNTPCDHVLEVIMAKVGICSNLIGDVEERKTFCQTFDSCVIWKPQDKDNERQPDAMHSDTADNASSYSQENLVGDNLDDEIDCDALTSCEWKGMKRGYIGDGICHEFIDGCYNSKVCNYDGGDCCPDTCHNSTLVLNGVGHGCGSDGYLCKDPESDFCQMCGAHDGRTDQDGVDTSNADSKTAKNVNAPKCNPGETPYRLFQYDSFGDGWDKTVMTITNSREDVTHTPLYEGKLNDGFEGMEYLCLATQPSCYQVKLAGGYWGNEVSWEIKPMKNGTPAIASGGSPMECEFPVSGAHCENTCVGRGNVDPEEDEKYHSWHKMANCIGDKCILQLGLCEKDFICNTCVGSNDTPTYCLANELFNALAFCSECNCVDDLSDKQKMLFCQQKSREKHENEHGGSIGNNQEKSNNSSSTNKRVQLCSYDEFQTGLKSLNGYAECSGIDTVSALLTDYDPDNFGLLDDFENCSSEYPGTSSVKSALDCLRILENAIIKPDNNAHPDNTKVPIHAISSLAHDLLYDAENFCECSSRASSSAPVCQDFIHFKTLLYESLDACRALDVIDCDAWAEFYEPCKSNLLKKFKAIDFKNNQQQCDYVKNTCGNVGPLPSLRRPDCDQTISQEAWNFYLNFNQNCQRRENNFAKPQVGPRDPIELVGKPKAPMNTPDPNADDDLSPGDGPGGGFIPYYHKNGEKKKKYVPPEKRRKASSGQGKVRNIFIGCLLAGGAYWYLRHRYGDMDSFHWLRRFRFRSSNYYYGPSDDGSGMYDSLTMENAQATFQPPTLPPPPSAYYENQGYTFPMRNMNSG